MLIEADMFIAHIKKSDWLKESATKIFKALGEGRLKAQASSEVFHEIYYVFSDHAPLSVIVSNGAKLAATENLIFINADTEIYLSALDLMNGYGLTSIFDAIYAATVLTDRVPDGVIVSTDSVYDRIPGIKRLDPR